MELKYRIMCLLVVALSLSVSIGTAHAQDTPMQVIEHFLSLPHGIYKLSPEDRALLAKVKADPTPYIDAVRSKYDAPELISRDASEDSLHFERAITFTGIIDHPAAVNLLGHWYARLDTALGERPADRQLLLYLRFILDSLDRKHPDVTSRVIDRIDRMDYASRIKALYYLQRTGKNDPQVIESLQKLLTDKNSPLYGDRVLQRTIRSITPR